MKRLLILFVIAAMAAAGCGKTEKPLNLIFETDLGNDVDDAIAMDLLFKYMDEGKINLLGIGINKEGTAPAEFADIMCTWYGYPGIPVGIVRDGAPCENDGTNYAKAVVNIKDAAGNPAFARCLKDYGSLPDAHVLYRKILSKAKDNSVFIASVGFSTNLARLLRSGPDEYSKLDGKALVEKKVRLLVTMAGDFRDTGHHEYNVVKDIPAAKLVIEEWPTPLVTSPYEVGDQALYPAKSIENDFTWAGLHPMVEAYKAYLPMPYDRPCWDPTAVLYAVEGEKWFGISEPGTIEVSPEGSSFFTPDPAGNRRYLTVDSARARAITDHFVETVTLKPASRGN